jgi:hypothetical protein
MLGHGVSAGAQTPKTPAAAPAKPAAAAAPATPAADKFTLVYKAQAGQTKRVKGELNFTLAADGSQVPIVNKQVSKITYTVVAPNGDITFEDVTESSEMTVNGQRRPDDSKDEKDTTTIHPDGTLVSYKSGSTEKDEDHLSTRIYSASTPVYPKKELAIGDKWSYDYAENAALGTRKARADFELLAAEKVGSVDALKIKMTYAESGATPNITGSGTIWVEKSSGDPVRSEYKLDGVPFGSPVIGSGTVTETRIEGGPLPGSQAAGAKDKTIDETVKEFTKIPGAVTLYRKKDATKDTIYAELREDQIDKLMMLETTAGTGTASQVVTGDPIDDLVFKFTRTDDRIIMTVPTTASGPRTRSRRPRHRCGARSRMPSFSRLRSRRSRRIESRS